jgi:hypothetical protein
MKKTKRSRIAFWLVGCSALLVAALAARAQTQNYVVDDFAPAGVGPANPTNYDYYPSAQNYQNGQIDAVWWNWFGGAFVTNQWDATSDASNNPSSGSLKITLNWSSANSQFVLWDQGTNNNYFALGLNATTFTNFQCDVRFAPGSASDAGNTGGQPIFGHLQFGLRTSGYGQDYFGGVDIAATNTDWVHVSITLNAISDANLLNMGGLLIHIDRNYYNLNLNGPSTLWVDNIKFVGSTTVISNPPPTLGMQKITPALRAFIGSANIYGRSQLTTVNASESWIGGSYPKTYSFTLLDFPTVNQVQAMMEFIPGPAYTGNSGADYGKTNSLWLQILNDGAGGYTADIAWKTNAPNHNPPDAPNGHTELSIASAHSPVGTWTLTFNNATSGTLSGPGTNDVPFTINDPNVVADWQNPCVLVIGNQPNGVVSGEGLPSDYSAISVTGVAGGNIVDDFTKATSLDPAWTLLNCDNPDTIVLVTTNTPYWVTWTLPDTGFTDTNGNPYGFIDDNGNGYLAVTTNLTSGQWVVPEYYNGYNTGINIPGTAQQGTMKWTLIPANCLPTVDGLPQSGQPLSPNAFFRLYNTLPPNP